MISLCSCCHVNIFIREFTNKNVSQWSSFNAKILLYNKNGHERYEKKSGGVGRAQEKTTRFHKETIKCYRSLYFEQNASINVLVKI